MKFVNRDRFMKQLFSVVPEAERELADANQKSAAEFVAMAQRLAPPGGTGALHDSIRMYPGQRPGSWVVEAGGPGTTKPVRSGQKATYDYSKGIEFSHKTRPNKGGSQKKVAAEPFFWPAYRAQKRPMKGRATRALRKAIKAKGFGTNG
jgi:hypothetical protein